jgi:hypothetical protein
MVQAYEKATSDVPIESHVKSEFQLFKVRDSHLLAQRVLLARC